MGQYYMPILGDKNGLHCKVFNRSVDDEYTLAKLTEHSWWLNPFVNSFSHRLYNKKGRVCWVGDYANQEDDFDFPINSSLHSPTYNDVWGDNVKLLPSKSVDFSLDDKFLINHDTMQYINLNEYKATSIDKDGWSLHPLPLLTAVGNDRGLGDFHEGNIGYEYVGIWAWHLISIRDKPLIRSTFAEKTGFDVVECPFIFSFKEYPHMLANIDGIVTENNKSKALLEIKTVGEYAASDWDDGLPLEYYLQIQHYLAVTDLQKAYCAVLIGGNKFSHQVIERDTDTIDTENKLKSFLGDNEGGQSPSGFSVNWKSINSNKLDTARLKAEHPDIFEQYSIPSTSRRFSISKSKNI